MEGHIELGLLDKSPREEKDEIEESKEDDNKVNTEQGMVVQPKLVRLPSLKAFYLSPYLTCSECNSLAFIDTAALRRCLIRLEAFQQEKLSPLPVSSRSEQPSEAPPESSEDSSQSDSEKECDSQSEETERNEKVESRQEDEIFGLDLQALPRCPGCRRTHTWVVGAHDLTKQIQSDRKAQRRLIRQQHRVITRVQAIIRGIRGRQEAASLRRAKEEYEALLYYCASQINAFARGRLARREAKVEKSLAILKDVHPTIMQEALRPWKGHRVFWYKRKAELNLLFKDYKLLVERLGNDPPLHRVENNINTIANRVTILNCKRAVLIQKRVRGMIGRKLIRQYKKELAFITEKKTAAVFVLQRAYRCWAARCKLIQVRVARRTTKIGDSHAALRRQFNEEKQAQKLKAKVLSSYSFEVKRARMLKQLYGAQQCQERRQELAQLTVASSHALDRWQTSMDEKRETEKARERERDAFIMGKISSNKFFKPYFAEEIRERRTNFIEELSKHKARRKRRILVPLTPTTTTTTTTKVSSFGNAKTI